MIDRRQLGLGMGALALSSTAHAASARPWPYLIGADVSWIPQDEAQGAVFFENGVQKDPLDILKGAGFNAIKLRVFVDPENGYSKKDPQAKWCGLDQSIAFAKRIRARGFHLSLTFHYSDTWADPQHQDKPAAWKDLPFDRLVEAVHAHTRDSLTAMKTAGVAPDLVLIGNETTFGTLWPDGRVPLPVPTGNPQTDAVHLNVPGAGGFDRFAALLKAGLAGVHEATPQAKTAVHNHLGRHWEIVKHWTDSLRARDVRCDAVGFSCYQQAAEGDWENTFANFGKRYPEMGVFVAEYSSRKRYVNDIAYKAGAWGGYIWEPTRHQEAIFDKDGENAGEGPRPNLLSQGINAAEAPGAAPATEAPKHKRTIGGRYDANGLLSLYRQMAKDYAK
ncbi:glycosyl hydrolase 53 family protein [Asticcacaulis sp. AND118]|uniref:glycosyl hydrolase 53 family protein n=1 Tax=Asticcacaulis sp. AND118 TaxID=2840468 RepID=UPI001CFF6BDA|nr:glycosyl hydrolase 53 family protein [Asticcacaulis sp. AND118]UDF03932.1 arabinogalactan endo-1,4-beta-galactosidase [Asticcacaulis sp. AND118]